MSEKFIDREYLLDSFKDYNTDIVEKKFDNVNSNLDCLGYGENGAYNLLDLSKLSNSDFDIEEGNIINKLTDVRTWFNFYVDFFDKDTNFIETAANDVISSNESKDLTFSLITGCEKIRLKHNGTAKDIYIGIINIADMGLKENDTITVHISVSSGNPTVVGGIVIKELAIVKGDTFIGYKPYIPSVKMLAEEVNAQKNDLGGLSFSVSGTTLSITDGTNTWTLSN